MSGWIKIDKDLPESIRFGRLVKSWKSHAMSRGVTRDECDAPHVKTLLLGALIRLWIYADSHIRDDNTIEATFEEIDEHVGVPDFAKSMPSEWLIECEDGRLELPDFLEKNGSSASERKRAAKRQAEFRGRKRGETRGAASNAPVTPRNGKSHARPDQTRLDQTRPDQTHTQSAREKVNSAPRETETERMAELVRIRHLYPKGDWPQSDWLQAERQISTAIDQGEPWEHLRDGAERYAKHVRSKDDSPRWVMSPIKFFSTREKRWREEWPAVPRKASFNDILDRIHPPDTESAA